MFSPSNCEFIDYHNIRGLFHMLGALYSLHWIIQVSHSNCDDDRINEYKVSYRVRIAINAFVFRI